MNSTRVTDCVLLGAERGTREREDEYWCYRNEPMVVIDIGIERALGNESSFGFSSEAPKPVWVAQSNQNHPGVLSIHCGSPHTVALVWSFPLGNLPSLCDCQVPKQKFTQPLHFTQYLIRKGVHICQKNNKNRVREGSDFYRIQHFPGIIAVLFFNVNFSSNLLRLRHLKPIFLCSLVGLDMLLNPAKKRKKKHIEHLKQSEP